MFQLIYIFLLQLIVNCFPLFFVMVMFANKFETVPSVECNHAIDQTAAFVRKLKVILDCL